MPYELLHYKKHAKKHIHLGICGSVAAYKSLELMRAFLKSNIHVSATLTPSAENSYSRSVLKLSVRIKFTDKCFRGNFRLIIWSQAK